MQAHQLLGSSLPATICSSDRPGVSAARAADAIDGRSPLLHAELRFLAQRVLALGPNPYDARTSSVASCEAET